MASRGTLFGVIVGGVAALLINCRGGGEVCDLSVSTEYCILI